MNDEYFTQKVSSPFFYSNGDCIQHPNICQKLKDDLGIFFTKIKNWVVIFHKKKNAPIACPNASVSIMKSSWK